MADAEYERRLDDKKRVSVTLDVRLPAKLSLATLIERLESQPGVRRVHVRSVG